MDQSWQKKYKLLIFDSIDSTNSEAIRLAKTKPIGDFVIWAKSQTSGRGRAGKDWQSNIGNLYVSILINNYIPFTVQPQLAFVTALAVYDVVSNLIMENESGVSKNVKIKWPNDILVNNKKISGILLESLALNNKNSFMVVGIGININSHPTLTQPSTDLSAESAKQQDLEQVLSLLMISFDKYFCLWKKDGFLKIREEWLGKAARLGELITIKNNNDEFRGIFENIDINGNIELKDDKGQLSTHLAGEILFGISK
ncbi:MAG: biotin--[acetyl-CoA-carboxylase] ligase [Janthinobacterium lividum]